jgi:hypothetical protein
VATTASMTATPFTGAAFSASGCEWVSDIGLNGGADGKPSQGLDSVTAVLPALWISLWEVPGINGL